MQGSSQGYNDPINQRMKAKGMGTKDKTKALLEQAKIDAALAQAILAQLYK